jgi:hypothetical protein
LEAQLLLVADVDEYVLLDVDHTIVEVHKAG